MDRVLCTPFSLSLFLSLSLLLHLSFIIFFSMIFEDSKYLAKVESMDRFRGRSTTGCAAFSLHSSRSFVLCCAVFVILSSSLRDTRMGNLIYESVYLSLEIPVDIGEKIFLSFHRSSLFINHFFGHFRVWSDKLSLRI